MAYRRLITEYEREWSRRRVEAANLPSGSGAEEVQMIRRGTLDRIGLSWLRAMKAVRRWRRQWDSRAREQAQSDLEDEAAAATVSKEDPFRPDPNVSMDVRLFVKNYSLCAFL